MEKLKISTGLLGKDEVFKALAVANVMKLPILLKGVPGTGKTACVLDYGKSKLVQDNIPLDEISKYSFVIETDEQTRSAEIKGRPNMEELMIHNKYELDVPISSAKFVVINEVDKASSALRNSLLAVMNEKKVFHGKKEYNCEWELFVATCNEIPQDEVNSPFWDRFVLKVNVDRMTAATLESYFKGGGKKSFITNLGINYPDATDLAKVRFSLKSLMTVYDNIKTLVSDRTMVFFPDLIKTVSLVYGLSPEKSIVKAVELVLGPETANTISGLIINAHMKAINSRIEMLSAVTNPTEFQNNASEILNLTEDQYKKANITLEDKDSVMEQLKELAMEKFETEDLEAIQEEVETI